MNLAITKSNTIYNTSNMVTTFFKSGNYSTKNWLYTAILVWVLFFIPCLAQSASSAENRNTEEERWFEIELIVFAHNNNQAYDSEKWPEITGLKLPNDIVELSQPSPESQEELTTEKETQALVFEQVNPDPGSVIKKPIPMPKAFVMLSNKELQLKESYIKLIKSSKFDPMLHVGWRQPTYSEKHAQAVLLYEGITKPEFTQKDPEKTSNTANNKISKEDERENNDEMINPRFAGTIRLSVSRYLHFAADLVYRAPISQLIAIPVQDHEIRAGSSYQTVSYPQGPAYNLDSWNAIRGFRLKESRRMRSKRLHYLDHPFMGIIVLITPVELPEDGQGSSSTENTGTLISGNQ